jgi:predicted RecA/RadA family phage recombinase
MATEADTVLADASVMQITTTSALEGGRVIQLPDGRAGIVLRDKAATTAAAPAAVVTNGLFSVVKTSGIVFLDGGRVYWDHSANAATFRKVNDRDFYIGRAVGDTASTATAAVVNLNVQEWEYDLSFTHHAVLSVPTGTQAVGGFGFPKSLGSANSIELTATNEAQCIDMLSVNRFALSSNVIIEATVRIPANGSTSAVDFNIGVANATSTTDADSIAESIFFHIDGGALDIFAESDDGTTEVAATDTTVNATEGSAVANRLEFWIDLRNPASAALYIDGVRVLSGTTFNIAAATGPLGLLAHLEKTSSTATGRVVIDQFVARFAEE